MTSDRNSERHRSTAQRTLRDGRSADARFACCYFALFTILGVVIPYFQKLLELQGFNEEQIGFILGASSTVGIVAPPLWGWLSDHSRHRRRLLAVAAIGSLGAFLSFAVTTAFWLAIPAALVFGFFFRPLIPLTDGMALRYIAEHGGDYGRIRTAGSASFILVIITMEALGVAGPSGRTVILATAAVCLLWYTATTGLLPLTEREQAERASRTNHARHYDPSIFYSAPFIAFTVVAFLGRFAMFGYYSFFTLYLQNEIDFQEAGYVWIIGPIAEIPVIFFSSAIVKRLGVRCMLALGSGAAAVRLVGTALAPNVLWIVFLQFLHAFTFGAFYTASIHYIQRLVPADMKQSAMTIFASLTFGLGSIAGSSIGGVVVYHLGYRTMYASFGGVAFCALVGLILFVREPPPADNA